MSITQRNHGYIMLHKLQHNKKHVQRKYDFVVHSLLNSTYTMEL